MPLSAFARDLIAQLPEADRAAATALLDKPEAAAANTFLDAGASRHADFSRASDDLRRQRAEVDRQLAANTAYHEQLRGWYEEHQPILDAGKKALGTGGGDPTPTPAGDGTTATGVTRSEMEKFVSEREAGVVPFVAETNRLTLQHYQQFGEPLDLSALMADPQIRQLGLRGVYEKTFATQLQARAAAAETTRINGLVEARLAEERKARGTRPLYPVGVNEPPSPLDQLDAAATKTNPSEFSPEAAADEYMALAAKRVS